VKAQAGPVAPTHGQASAHRRRRPRIRSSQTEHPAPQRAALAVGRSRKRAALPIETGPRDRNVAKAIARREAAGGRKAIVPKSGFLTLEIGRIRSCTGAQIWPDPDDRYLCRHRDGAAWGGREDKRSSGARHEALDLGGSKRATCLM
jgi:hypothetical protein